MRKNLKRTSIIALAVMLVAQLVVLNINTHAATAIDNYLMLNHNAVNSKGEAGTNINAKVSEEVTLNYSVNSSDIALTAVNQTPKQKEIVLVIDTSGSMTTKDMENYQRRIDVAVDAAKSFVDKFANTSNVKIGVVNYSSKAYKVSDITNSFSDVKTKIEGLRSKASGSTNIGDGLRTAYYMLQKFDDSTSKYVVLLTDGQPNTFSYTGSSLNNYTYFTAESGQYSVASLDDSDSQGLGLGYANTIGDMISKTSINGFMIGFTADINKNKLDTIAQHAKAQSLTARNSSGLNSVYDKIADQIKNEIIVDNVSFEETFPSNVNIVKVPDGFTRNGQIVTGALKNIKYTIVDGKYKIVEPLNFAITVSFNTSQTYNLDSAKLKYRDFALQSGEKTFNAVSVNVTPSVPRTTQAPVELTRQVDKSSYKIQNGTTEDIVVNYTINPKPIDFYSIAPEDYFKEKYIVVVADNSGSMGDAINGKAKLDILKGTLVASDNSGFINKFQGNTNVNIALVAYSDYAKLGNNLSSNSDTKIKNSKGEIQDFADMSDDNQVKALKSQINVMTARGSTNLGDGLRRAYYLLSKVDSNAKKYVILMTDGVPTAFTYDNISYNYGNNGVFVDGDSDVTGGFSSFNNVTLNYKDGEAVNYAYNYGDNDSGGYALSYSKSTAKMLSDASMGSFIIGFSNGINANKLSQIASSATGKYKEAMNASDLNSVYNEIAGEISKDLPIGNLTFSATLPTGVNFKNITAADGTVISGFTAGSSNNGQVVTGSMDKIGNISYRLNDAKTYFEAQPISFKLVLNGSLAGDYNLLKSSTFVKYIDLNKSETTLYSSNDISFTITNNPSVVLKHGLFVDNNDDVNNSFRESGGIAAPLSVVNGTRYNAALLVQSTSNNTNVNVTIGKRDINTIKDTSDVVVRVYKLNSDGKTYDKTKAITNAASSSISDGIVTININLAETGNYLVTYSFYMKAPDNVTVLSNSAKIDQIDKPLDMKLEALPEMY